MIARVAIVGLLVVGACNDTRRAPRVATASPAAARAPAAPVLVPPSIDNRDGVPEDARGRLESTVLAVVENRTTDFIDTVSSGGFTVGALALTRDQVEAELAGRSVAELTNVTCASVDACQWIVIARSATQLELEARANGALVGAVRLVHEDDGSWGVAGARPIEL